MKMYIYKTNPGSGKAGGLEICRSTGKVQFSRHFPSLRCAQCVIEDVPDATTPEVKESPEPVKKVKKTRAKKHEEVENVD